MTENTNTNVAIEIVKGFFMRVVGIEKAKDRYIPAIPVTVVTDIENSKVQNRRAFMVNGLEICKYYTTGKTEGRGKNRIAEYKVSVFDGNGKEQMTEVTIWDNETVYLDNAPYTYSQTDIDIAFHNAVNPVLAGGWINNLGAAHA